MEHGDHQHRRPVQASDHGEHAEPAAEHHAGHGGHRDHAPQFRELFWISCLLALPVVFFSEMVGNLLGYAVPDFPGASAIRAFRGANVQRGIRIVGLRGDAERQPVMLHRSFAEE